MYIPYIKVSVYYCLKKMISYNTKINMRITIKCIKSQNLRDIIFLTNIMSLIEKL